MDSNAFDDRLRQHLEASAGSAATQWNKASAWEAINEELHGKKRRPVLFWWVAAALALLLLGSGTALLFEQHQRGNTLQAQVENCAQQQDLYLAELNELKAQNTLLAQQAGPTAEKESSTPASIDLQAQETPPKASVKQQQRIMASAPKRKQTHLAAAQPITLATTTAGQLPDTLPAAPPVTNAPLLASDTPKGFQPPEGSKFRAPSSRMVWVESSDRPKGRKSLGLALGTNQNTRNSRIASIEESSNELYTVIRPKRKKAKQ